MKHIMAYKNDFIYLRKIDLYWLYSGISIDNLYGSKES